ncbi:MAG: hypothetical protein ACWGOX_15965 [Desulforhopalus sp.]
MEMRKTLQTAVDVLLNNDCQYWQLSRAIGELRGVFLRLSPILASENKELLSAGTQLPSGLAIAPDFAATVLSDTKRTVKFLRGIKDGIEDCLKNTGNGPLHLLYAGCGPYATLVFPLLHFFRPGQLKVTLLDIHQLSLDSALAIAGKIGVMDYLDSLICCDASQYLHPKDDPIHMVVTETMAQLLYKEPQVSITLNLAPQMVADGIFIPEKVIISLRAINSANDYLRMTGRLPENEKVQLHLQDIFTLDKNCHVDSESSGTQIRLKNIIIQEIAEQFDQLKLFTEIQIYDNHFLKAYESGLTSPLDFNIDNVKAGDNISFSYRIGHVPELTYAKI